MKPNYYIILNLCKFLIFLNRFTLVLIFYLSSKELSFKRFKMKKRKSNAELFRQNIKEICGKTFSNSINNNRTGSSQLVDRSVGRHFS